MLNTSDEVRVSSIIVGVMPLLELRIPKVHSFPYFSSMCFDILRGNFVYDFHLMNFRLKDKKEEI